jgi:hypothetical protein
MSLRRAQPIAFRAQGLSDAIDSTTVFQGAMAALANLIPDPSTKNLWQARPAAIEKTNFIGALAGPFSPGFGPGFQQAQPQPIVPGPEGAISVFKIIGSIVFGMLKGDTTYDFPFAYNLQTGQFIIVNGIPTTPLSSADQGKLPFTQPTTGDWTPPSMDLVGTQLFVTHPGFAGGVNNRFFGWFDISNLGSITWNTGNLVAGPSVPGGVPPISFTVAPSFIRNFNGRAYWIQNTANTPGLIFSDPLAGNQITLASQVITFDDNVALTALAPLGLTNVTGGIVQALLVFKGISNIYQITGDAALNNLGKNALNVPTGTFAPNSIAPTPKGVAFIAPDGLRFVTFQATVTDPIGWDGMGKVAPFLFAIAPSRICAAANGTLYRVTVQDGSLNGTPVVEYWFDFARGVWSGFHTFPARFIAEYQNTFIMASQLIDASLWQSDYLQSGSSIFREPNAGNPSTTNPPTMGFAWVTSMLPDPDVMAENSMIETTVYLAMDGQQQYSVQSLNQDGAAIAGTSIINTAAAAAVWGATAPPGFVWGGPGVIWGGGHASLFPRPVNWPNPVVFRRMQIAVSGNCGPQLRIGSLHMRYEMLGYLQQGQAA